MSTCRGASSPGPPRSFMVERVRLGVPYLAPHGSLLYRANAHGRRTQPIWRPHPCSLRMSADARAWLRSALNRPSRAPLNSRA